MATPRSVRRRKRRSLRPLLVVCLLAMVAGASWWAYVDHRRTHVTLAFAADRVEVPALELSFFPDRLSFSAPSPPPALGHVQLDGDRVVVGDDVVPGSAVVRYRGEGVGAGFAYVKLGGDARSITLRPPASLRGRVGEPVAFWCFGWRCAGYRPIAGAEVTVMGGGEHGIDLVTTTTDEQGHFTVTGFDGELDALGLRVRARGYALSHQRIEGLREHAGERAIVALAPAPVRRGRLDLHVPIDPTSLRVLARGLPGIEATPAADGSFELHHVPPGVEARLVVYGLPATAAQAPARTRRDEVVQLAIVAGARVSGRVLGLELQPMPGAIVWADDLPATRTDADGRYELAHVLPGRVQFGAEWKSGTSRKAQVLRGSRTFVLEPGKDHRRVDITLDK